MAVSVKYIKDLIIAIGFIAENGKSDVYIKTYPSHSNYSIRVDFNAKSIDYGKKIKKDSSATSNFSKDENFVVLECVDRLLEKGYKPKNIMLEKIYPAGRGHSGNLDILIYDDKKSAYLMIECKTWDAEHIKEHNKMIKDGGQLFTYYGFDRETKYLCLYSSSLDNGKVVKRNDIVPVSEEWKTLSNTKEMHNHWNKTFKDNGIFEDYASPYNITYEALTCGMLKDLKEEDSGKIFNQIMEILRHNVVSDKPNAFNKLLNLFVCKIIDENRNPDDELKFQWLEDDTDEKLQFRLSELYKNGMKRFLNIEIKTPTEKEVDDELKGTPEGGQKQRLKKMIIDAVLKQSPHFAFKEVLDEKSFIANAKIVKEMVILLQDYKFRYNQKHQFLGDFFELLLNTSMKQESGQFFTPVPITRFIISSLPIKEFVEKRILESENDSEILPFVIDYATGSGHFLTEYMEQVQNIIEDADIDKASPTIKRKINSWRENVKFDWAEDYVYGIDLDDRLVKTAKVSAFFNGDGEANIIWANGLGNFEKTDEYRGKLSHFDEFDKQNNGQFDILISNPPYSVDAFKGTLKHGEETFELYNGITDTSSEIECLFIERMKQLLKVGGWAGVILPVSILSNSGIHSKAREIIFKYFKVKSIVELGSNTFMATGTNTVILFLERRADGDYREIELAIDDFMDNKKDVTVSGIERAFSKYVANVYDDLSFDDYVKIIKGDEVDHELYADYKKVFDDKNWDNVKTTEKEKLLYFILTYDQEMVMVKTGQKQEEKNFLGYEFSNRRGHEGLHWLPNGTKLYNEDNPLDPKKANSYIYNAFVGNKVDVDENIIENVSYNRMSDLLEYNTSKFDKKVNSNKRSKFTLLSKYESVPIYNLCTSGRGRVINRQYIETNKGDYPVYSSQTRDDGIFGYINTYDFDGEYVTWTTDGAKAGTVFYRNGKFNCTNVCGTLKAITDVNMKYLAMTLGLIAPHYVDRKGNDKLMNNVMESIKIPLPPLDVQQTIVDEINKADDEYNSTRVAIETYSENIEDVFNKLNTTKKYRISDVATMVKRGKSAKYGTSGTQIIKSGQARGYIEFDFTQRHYVDKSFVSDERNLVKGDVLINSTGVGTAGRVTLFDLDGDFVVDSHITIVRVDKEKTEPKYLLYSLANIGFKNIEAMATGQSGQIELSLDTINAITVSLPSLAEQREAILEIEGYENKIARAKSKLVELEQSKKAIINKYLQ